jgi:hypothetical protein
VEVTIISHKRPAKRAALKAAGRMPDDQTMQFLVSNRRTRVLMDASGLAFAFGLILLVSQSA